jgi:hypothetical protein
VRIRSVISALRGSPSVSTMLGAMLSCPSI